jgi:hypothetical protein
MRARWWMAGMLVALGLACGGFGGDDLSEPEVGEATPEVEPDATKGGKGGKGKARDRIQANRDANSSGGGGGGAAPPSGGDAPKADTAPSGITAKGNSTWDVTRARFKKWEDKPTRFAKVKKKSGGWALKGVTDRDARWVGFETNDVIVAVNGRSVGSEAEAAAAYASLQGEDRYKVKFKRDGGTRTHIINVVD